ncbi:hypothetical protein [Acidithiobacillus sulfuriphilus]|uniref:hypothetical protein n=1 Tax=Acidithiobacillus sulfuriphilus TaxID=1867749 RepID=UPI003F5DF2C1
MGISGNDFRACYYFGPNGETKISVAGKVTAIDGCSYTLVRAVPQGMNPRQLMLQIVIEPYTGMIRPHIVCEQKVYYNEIADGRAYNSVHIDNGQGSVTIPVAM